MPAGAQLALWQHQEHQPGIMLDKVRGLASTGLWLLCQEGLGSGSLGLIQGVLIPRVEDQNNVK